MIKEVSRDKGNMEGLKAGLGISIMIMSDKYSLLMKKEIEGKSRQERFAELYLDLVDSFNKNLLTMQDIEDTIYEETGMRLEI